MAPPLPSFIPRDSAPRKPAWPRVAVTLLVVAVAAAILTWLALNGSNPIHFTAPTG